FMVVVVNKANTESRKMREGTEKEGNWYIRKSREEATRVEHSLELNNQFHVNWFIFYRLS
ncbi:hypothetical protein KR038_007785, partial [Drosophila bunnanda]